MNEETCLIIYIRHAEKLYKNGESKFLKHDPGITDSGIKKSKEVANFLLNLYGAPNYMLASPYRRTRETAITMNSVIKNSVEIIYDENLSEYLGNHRDVQMDISVETQIFHPPHPETFEEMKERVNKHYHEIKKFMKYNKNKIVWVVSHGIIIKQVAEFFDTKINYFPPLTCLIFVDKKDNINGEIIFPQGI